MIKLIGTFKDFSDETIKCVFDCEDKKVIEMSLLFNKIEKDVICVPTHHFCNLGCKMCHLTNNSLNKKMNPLTIDDFIEALFQTLTDKGKRRTSKKNLVISFMGVGEPLLNIDLIKEVYKKEKIIKEKLNYENIAYSVSTMMPNDNILKLMDIAFENDIPLKVHFSMHTPIDKDRYKLIPSTKVSVSTALSYLKKYREKLQSNKVLMDKYIKLHSNNDPTEIHYTLIKDINDGRKELTELIKLLSIYKISIKFIRFNPINELERSKQEDLFVNTIHKNIPDLRIKTYSPPGREVGSSCGEFTKHYYHEEIETEEQRKEFEEWKSIHQIN